MGDDELLDLEHHHEAREEHDVVDAHTLVQVLAPLQHHDRDSADLPPPQTSGVARSSTRKTPRNLGIRYINVGLKTQFFLVS